MGHQGGQCALGVVEGEFEFGDADHGQPVGL
jgi:hypothetical protein